MDLLDLTRGRLVQLGLRAEAKEHAIEQLLDFLVAAREIPREARDSVLDAVFARERRLSTGLEDGVAIPHGMTDSIEEEVAALGVYPEGVPFESCDGQPARLVILLVTPGSKRYRHVSNLAAIARQLRRTELREQLVRARELGEALTALKLPPPQDPFL